jgi:hypothetical protein
MLANIKQLTMPCIEKLKRIPFRQIDMCIINERVTQPMNRVQYAFPPVISAFLAGI